MLDGFFTGSRWSTNKTKKQKMEERIKDSVLNMVIDRDQSFLKTARGNNTSIIVNNRDGGIQEFYYDGRRYISFPSSMEDEFSELKEWEAEEKMDSLIRLVTTPNDKEFGEEEMNLKLDSFESNYKNITGTNTGFEKEIDSTTGEITNNPFEFRATKTDEENKEYKEEGEDSSTGTGKVTSRGIENESASENSESSYEFNTSEQTYEFQDTDLTLDSEVPREMKDSIDYYSEEDYYETFDKHREEVLKNLAKRIVKSFKGRISKQRTMIPSKRLVSKSLAVDISEKIYEDKKGDNGKFLNINLVIDMSGSMGGDPVKNATEMIYIFNEIASAGHLSGNVIWSDTGGKYCVKFPMPRKFIKHMVQTGGGEGLGKNLQFYKDKLKEADTNICMTDGQLTDDPILKKLYAKEQIEIIGVYVNKRAKDLTEYTGSLDRWFTRSLVRHTTEELCEKLIQFSLRKKK